MDGVEASPVRMLYWVQEKRSHRKGVLMDYYNFHYGQEFEAYKGLGAHVTDDGVRFCVYAPAAARAAVIGEFSGWEEIPMSRGYDGTIWECFVPEA